MTDSPSPPDASPVQPEPLIEVENESGFHVLARLNERADYIVGSGSGVQIFCDIKGVAGRHFSIKRGAAYCLLKPLEAVTLNGREVSHEVQLVNDDRIGAGKAVFRYACPQDGSFPWLRVADTFWILRTVPDSWQFSSATGLFRHYEDEFIENIYFNQDGVPDNDLDGYVETQFAYLSHVTEGFSTQQLTSPQLYRAESCALHRHEFLIEGRRVCQHQFFTLKNKLVGIASWTVPASVAEQDQYDVANFSGYLKQAYFG